MRKGKVWVDGKYYDIEELINRNKKETTVELLKTIIRLLEDIKNELKGGGLLEGNTGGVKAEDRYSKGRAG